MNTKKPPQRAQLMIVGAKDKGKPKPILAPSGTPAPTGDTTPVWFLVLSMGLAALMLMFLIGLIPSVDEVVRTAGIIALCSVVAQRYHKKRLVEVQAPKEVAK